MGHQLQSGTTALVEWAAGSCTGRCRCENEDAFGVSEEHGLFVVADGCGGRDAGRRASDLAVQCLLESTAAPHPAAAGGALTTPPAERLAHAVMRANEVVLHAARRDPMLTGMGCTLAALRLDATTATITHVGDCRVGRMSVAFTRAIDDEEPRELHWLTSDHAVWTEAQRAGCPDDLVAQFRAECGTVVMRAVGASEEGIDVDVQYRTAHRDETYLLCSDGLSRQVEQRIIGQILRHRERSLVDRCRSLLDAAETAGGHDNTTLIVAQTRGC